MSMDDLAEALTNGGVALQQVVAMQLAERCTRS